MTTNNAINSSNALVQRARVDTRTSATGTTTVPVDNTIPQNTEGDQYMSLAFTPKATSNILQITVTIIGSSSVVNTLTASLFQDTTANALASGAASNTPGGAISCITFSHSMTAGTTSSTTFKVRMGGFAGGTTTFNGTSGAQIYGGVCASSITIEEFTP